MAIETDIATGAACWASYLINDDASGLEDDEIALCDKWAASLESDGWRIVDMLEDSERFTWHYSLHTGDNCAGGNVCDYVIHRSN